MSIMEKSSAAGTVDCQANGRLILFFFFLPRTHFFLFFFLFIIREEAMSFRGGQDQRRNIFWSKSIRALAFPLQVTSSDIVRLGAGRWDLANAQCRSLARFALLIQRGLSCFCIRSLSPVCDTQNCHSPLGTMREIRENIIEVKLEAPCHWSLTPSTLQQTYLIV